MKKVKVFMPCGTVQTILAESWAINEAGRLRFADSHGNCIAYFPPGGWHGLHDIEVAMTKAAV